MMCPQSWRGSPASLQLSQSPYSCPFFALPLRCSPLKFFVPGASLLSLELLRLPRSFSDFRGASQTSAELHRLPRSFPDFHGASQTSAELPRLPWSFAVFPGVPQSSPEFPSLLRSSPVFAGAPPCPPELLLLPRSPFPSEFFGDSLRSFPCLPRAFLSSPMTLLLHHSFAVP